MSILSQKRARKLALKKTCVARFARTRHLTLEHFTFTPKYIAKHLHAKKNEITKAIEELKRLGLLEDCNSFADSVLRDKLYELCEQYAKTENKPMIFFYR